MMDDCQQELSEETALSASCVQTVIYEARKSTRSKFKDPKVLVTPTPRFNHFLDTLSLYEDRSRVQTFVLDVLAQLRTILEGKSISFDNLTAASTATVQLIGNANAKISHLPCEMVLASLNQISTTSR